MSNVTIENIFCYVYYFLPPKLKICSETHTVIGLCSTGIGRSVGFGRVLARPPQGHSRLAARATEVQ